MSQDTSTSSRTIFVASSREARNRAQLLVDILSESFSPLPWWDDRAFPLGDYTFNRLINLSQLADAAVFLATKDDRVWFRGSENDAPRDNVVLELGIFASRLGAGRSLLLADPDLKLPSDLQGLTFLGLGEGIEKAARRVLTHLNSQFSKPPPPSPITIVADADLIPMIAGDAPKNWLMRAFYFGTVGARAWLSISLDPNYQDDAANARLIAKIRDLLEQSGGRFRTFVSLGPGDARLDERIAAILRRYDGDVSYVPVDISDGLLLNAARKLRQLVYVPIGMLADFEERLDFVLEQLPARTRGPYLFALLGNTFGNLDGSEAQFIDTLMWHLKPEDQLILGVAVRKSGGEPVRADAMSAGAIEFFAHGAACHLGETASEIKAKFLERVGFDEIRNGSEIPNTQTFKFYVKKGATKTICANLRRFDLDSLTRWLEGRRLKVRHQRLNESGPYDLAVLALQRK